MPPYLLMRCGILCLLGYPTLRISHNTRSLSSFSPAGYAPGGPGLRASPLLLNPLDASILMSAPPRLSPSLADMTPSRPTQTPLV